MSTVAEEITRISGCRENIKTAIAAKGVTVPTGAKLADCPALIASITGGGGGGVTSFVNTGFTATGEYSYTKPFTATQIPVPIGETIVTATPMTYVGGYPYQGKMPQSDATVYSTGATLVFPYTAMSYSMLQETGIVQARIGDGTAHDVGTYTLPNPTGNGTASAAVNLNEVPTGDVYFVFSEFQDWKITAGFTAASSVYVDATATGLPYPQYDPSTTGAYTISGKTTGYAVIGTYTPAYLQFAYSGDYSISGTYDSGPSYTSATSDKTTRNYPFFQNDMEKYLTNHAPTDSFVIDSNYSYSYGTVVTGYTGYSGY